MLNAHVKIISLKVLFLFLFDNGLLHFLNLLLFYFLFELVRILFRVSEDFGLLRSVIVQFADDSENCKYINSE
jgi:hypothetical protein